MSGLYGSVEEWRASKRAESRESPNPLCLDLPQTADVFVLSLNIKDLDLTQKKCAEVLGVSPALITKILSGKRRASAKFRYLAWLRLGIGKETEELTAIEKRIYAAGFDKKTVAQRLGIPPTTFYNKCRNPHRFTVEELAKVEKVLEGSSAIVQD